MHAAQTTVDLSANDIIICETMRMRGLLVAYWLKHWTADRTGQGSRPTCNGDLFLFRVHSPLPQKLSRFSFVSFEGDVKSSVSGNPLKLALGISSSQVKNTPEDGEQG